MKLTKLIPLLNVSNIENSLEFYQQALGFNVVSDPAEVRDRRWAAIRSGNTELMLSETDCNKVESKSGDPRVDTDWPAIFYFYADDVVALYSHVIAEGYEPTPLEVTVYRMREFSLIDPDGHVLSCGQYAGR